MRRGTLVAIVSLAAPVVAVATGCELLIGTETRTLGSDSGGVDATDETVVPDAEADVEDASDAAVIPPDACGAACLSQAVSCGGNCVTIYNGCVAGCSNTPCKTGCATSESACFGNCDSTCTGCMTGAGCAAQSLCADASYQ
jgi:hypothetical protein